MTILPSGSYNLNHDDQHKEEFPDVCEILKRQVRKSCNHSLILNRLPIVNWLPKYKLNYLYADFVAGITVGLTAIPQGIAYAVVARLPPQYGLYAGFMGCFVYMIFGSCKDVTIGPTAIMALMVQRYVSASPDFAILSAFLSGLLIFACGLLNLGFLIQFISIPVTGGFTSAAAITIASGQVKSLLGLSGNSNEFIESWETVINDISKTQLWDTVLGVSTVILLLILRKFKDIKGKWANVFKYISLSRNALAVIGGTALAFVLESKGYHPFNITGEVESGFPPFKMPPFTTTINNETLSFRDMFHQLGGSVVAIPLVSILESVAVAKAFSKGKVVDASQEMIALGFCNLFGSFFGAMPTTGSFTRTAINHASGVRTPFGGVFTGGLVLLTIGFLTETLQYIPKATLAAVILSAMFFTIEFELAYEIWKTRRVDIIPFIVTLIACLLFGLEYGILLGILVNTIFVLYSTARPTASIETVKIRNEEILLITPNQSLPFSAAEYFRYKILKHASMSDNISTVIINGEFVNEIDSTVAINLKAVAEDLKVINKIIYFWNWKRQPIGVANRLDSEFGTLFKSSEIIEDMLLISRDNKIVPTIF